MDRGGSLKAAFSFGFNHHVTRHGASVGVFDDTFTADGSQQRKQIVFATDTNKIILQNSESVFHVNEPVVCLAVCQLPNTEASAKTDAVLIGTRSSLTAFDVFNNKTVFHRDMPEGVNCIKVGMLDDYKSENGAEDEIIVCGCGTTIWGIKPNGEDVFWTALGDDINVLELGDMDGDGRNELLVGSNGTEIKIFKNASFWNEFDEGDPTMALCALRVGTFAFGLSSGVVGVYSNGERMWRVKTKSQIVSLLCFPDTDHVVCVWHNGKIDIRSSESGEINCKDQIDGEMVAAFLADINGTGSLQLGLVYKNGQVHGIEYRKDAEGSADDAQKLMREYGQRKHNLLEELKNYERRENDDSAPVDKVTSIPPNTSLECSVDLTLERGLCLHLSINNHVPIKAVLLFAEGIFESECYAIHPNIEHESSELTAYFTPAKDIVAELFIKVFAGFPMEKQMHVFEINQILPRFATFLCARSLTTEPQSYIEFKLTQSARPDQLSSWLMENFILLEEMDTVAERLWNENGTFKAQFLCTRNNEPLIVEIKLNGETVIRHNNIESTGNILQSLTSHLNVKEQECRAFFPLVLESVENAINSMDEKYEINDKLTSDLSQRLNAVKECIVRAEDSLATRNVSDARKFYLRVAMLNRELVGQHTIRMSAREELLNSLKLLNVTIEQFSRLRVGTPASKLIQECRRAIANENLVTLPRLLQFGA
ncbi:ciliary BBSome complex subunit 2, middle region domain-containing protein [Ditylenchus destructor]|nr:ciliary BBSome complex subunit 2, middle region domain-containing protein [Ditylenchus destructor]